MDGVWLRDQASESWSKLGNYPTEGQGVLWRDDSVPIERRIPLLSTFHLLIHAVIDF